MKTPIVLMVVGILGVYLPIFTYHSMVKYMVHVGKYTSPMDAKRIISSLVHRLNAEVSEHLGESQLRTFHEAFEDAKGDARNARLFGALQGDFWIFLWSWKQKNI